MIYSGGAGVVIVGASLAGLTTAEGLRGEGYAGPITLIGEEDHHPYNRPPLSKQVLAGIWAIDRTTMRDSQQLETLGVRHMRGTRATRVDVTARTLTVTGATATHGATIPYEYLVAATGVAPRRFPNPNALRGVHSLRTIGDAQALQRDLDGAGHVAVIGAGILGCEIACAIRGTGREVTLIGRSPALRFGQTGSHLSAMIATVMHEHGVQMRMGAEVAAIAGDGAISALTLCDGSVVSTDLLVAAIGCTPVTDWLPGTHIDISDGVLCDENGRAADGVFAVGDVARWRDPVTGQAHRVEHQATAIEQAHAVARRIATGEPSPPIASFFWSELFGNRILVHGRLENGLPLTVLAGDPSHAGDSPDARFVGATIRNGVPTGLVGWNMPREFRHERARLIEQAAKSVESPKGVVVA